MEELKSITPEEYKDYMALKESIVAAKAQRSDLLDLVYATKRQLTKIETEFDLLQDHIDQTTDTFQEYVENLGKKYNLTMGVYNFADTEPHYITLANPQQ